MQDKRFPENLAHRYHNIIIPIHILLFSHVFHLPAAATHYSQRVSIAYLLPTLCENRRKMKYFHVGYYRSTIILKIFNFYQKLYYTNENTHE